MKELTPIKDKYFYSDDIWKYILFRMYTTMFRPLFEIVGEKEEPTTMSNALDRSSLMSALMSGAVWFNNDKFYGDFNAVIGKELRQLGANFNSVDKTYFIHLSDLPMEVRAAIATANSKFQEQQTAIQNKLNQMNTPPQIEAKEITKMMDNMFIDLHKQFSVSIPKNLAVPMELTPVIREAIAEDYTYNLNIYIKDWFEQDVIRLREQVNDAVAIGYRADHMRDVLQAEFGVAERKAKFLARQETSLLVSKYRETRYKEAGLNRYRWSTSRDQRVRHDHRELDGKIYDWDHPPVTDKHTGARNHPGEDYNCRCVAIPIVE